MLKKILLVAAALLAVLLIVAAMQPSEFRVVRSASIAAPSAVIFANVNELTRWREWSPWEKMDPAMKRSFAGPAAGPGATYAWDGNRDVGSGKMTIVESRPAQQVRLKLEFFEPMAGVCDAEFNLRPEGGQTAITWSMTGTNNYLAKIVCLFMNMDKMIGGQFEQGLAALKTISEGPAKK